MEILHSREVYADRRLSVREDTVRRPDGSTGSYAVVDGPDIALVLPLNGVRLRLVEQHRHPVHGRRWELPSGSVDVALDADPAATAARELREETGLEAGRLTPLGALEMSPSTTSQRCWVFLAEQLTDGAPETDVDEQDLRSAWFDRADVERMLHDGSISDAKSAAAYALLLVRERH